MFATVIAFFQEGQKTMKKSIFGIPHPTLWKRYCSKFTFQAVLKLAKGAFVKRLYFVACMRGDCQYMDVHFNHEVE